MPAAAVTPQEGWFVRTRISYLNKEYFVIDNKLSSAPWLVDLSSVILASSYQSPFLSAPSFTTSGESFAIRYPYLCNLFKAYYGSSFYPWFVDSDWMIRIYVNGVNSSIPEVIGYNLVAFDTSTYPRLTYNFSLGDSSGSFSPSAGNLLGVAADFSNKNGNFSPFVWNALNNYPIFSGATFIRPLGQYRPFSIPYYFGQGSFQEDVGAVAPIDIRNLCIAVVPVFSQTNLPAVPTGTEPPRLLGSVNAQLSIEFLCPVDKAPAGIAVGDRWPLVPPIEVSGTFEDAYKDWIDSALQNTPYGDASTVGPAIQGYNQQLEESDNWGTLATEGWQGIAPIFDSFDFVFTILAIVGVTFILLLLIKKGMA